VNIQFESLSYARWQHACNKVNKQHSNTNTNPITDPKRPTI